MPLTAHLDLKGAVHIGHSTGGGEVVHYLARHGESRVAKSGDHQCGATGEKKARLAIEFGISRETLYQYLRQEKKIRNANDR